MIILGYLLIRLEKHISNLNHPKAYSVQLQNQAIQWIRVYRLVLNQIQIPLKSARFFP